MISIIAAIFLWLSKRLEFTGGVAQLVIGLS